MTARIYKQPKSAGQSGLYGARSWIFEYGQSAPHRPTPLMGWTGSSDTKAQVRLKFASLEEAEAYARRHAIPYAVEPVVERIRVPKVYADNFAMNRIQNWTH